MPATSPTDARDDQRRAEEAHGVEGGLQEADQWPREDGLLFFGRGFLFRRRRRRLGLGTAPAPSCASRAGLLRFAWSYYRHRLDSRARTDRNRKKAVTLT